MKADGIRLAFTGAGRLAAGAFASLLVLCSTAGAETWTWNYTQFYMNESISLTPVIDPNTSTMVFLLTIIACCQLFNVLKTLYGWFMHESE
jgi:hypothetical protein